ncbi:MAG: hypothetical protein AAFP02_04900, partial [Bacteroidota bacterium]
MSIVALPLVEINVKALKRVPKFTYTPNERDKISASLYSSWDRYGLIERFQDRDEFRTGFNWQNLSGTVRWNRVLSPKAFINTSFFTTNYSVNLFNRSKDERGDIIGIP